MTEKEFLNIVCNGKEDVLQIFLDALSKIEVDYCVIGGLAVNAYAEPVVSLDLDVVVAAEDIEQVCKAVEAHFKIERFAHGVNLSTEKSSLRIQMQTDPRYRNFIGRASTRTVLGYEMKVASVEDVLQGKIWAYSDEERRRSKRQKDLADIARLVEAHPSLVDRLPEDIRKRIE
ncbi:MAG: nucleotidyl transferase AbiEii/AbiGii toxin family protein [bacterium]